MISDLETEVAALEALDLHALRDKWRERFGAPPKFRSTEMLRLLLAWRIQAVALGGLDRDTREALSRTGPIVAEGQDLGIGATFRRTWNGEEQIVTVVDKGSTGMGYLQEPVGRRRPRSPAPAGTARASLACGSMKAHALRDLHPQELDEEGLEQALQQPRCAARGLRSLHQEPGRAKAGSCVADAL